VSAKETLEEGAWDASDPETEGAPTPGLVLIFSVDRPAFGVIPLKDGAIEIGRGEIADVRIADERMSRAHARVAFDGRRWSVRDHGSRNRTAVDGERLTGERTGDELRLVRTGFSLFLLTPDTRPFAPGIAQVGGAVMGPVLQRAFKAVARAGRAARVLHVTGESGSGKEFAARAFHEAGPAPTGPFVAVNGATLPENLAERLLFGARKGAYSGAVDAPGYVQSAHGGTLFLDEVAELDLGVQAKLLRALEVGEVVRLGATQPERVDFRLCSATHADLRARVAEGQMRADFFFRIATPAVALPPLRARKEEIPWLVDRAARAVPLAEPHVSLVEACLLRRWPGNVRELLAEVRQAAELAVDEGGAVLARHLSEHAGAALTAGAPDPPEPTAAPAPAARPSDEAIAEALRAEDGNVARASRALGMHRTQLYRWMERRAQPGKDE
jgi:transcriptional regulator of acetoin/glycerol metabolism